MSQSRLMLLRELMQTGEISQAELVLPASGYGRDAGNALCQTFREAVRQHVEFGSHVAMQNSHAENDEDLYPLHEVPRWQWAGDRADQE